MQRIPVAGPWITDKEVAYVSDAAAHDWYEHAGRYPQRFERAFAEHVGVRYAVSVPHCTAAIHLSLVACGVGPGDEVVVPDVTWIASAAPIKYVGAEPVFADIDPLTWCLTAESLESCITSRTKAVIPVALYGNMPAMDDIRAVARRHNLVVIEDAAEAFGSQYRGRPAGSLGDTGVFSFHGSKTLTTGEGGMLVTDHEDIYRRVLSLRDHGRPPGDTGFFNEEVAFKYRMSSLQAALGLAQLERASELVARKREIFDWYRAELADLPCVALNAEPAGTLNSYWMSTLVWDRAVGLSKVKMIQKLKDLAIDTRPFFYPLSSLPAYAAMPSAQTAQRENVHAYRVSPYGINLPSSFRITRDQVAYVARHIRAIIADALQRVRERHAA
jgi:perosamine synthetase